jgi:ornithine cyclodeaminase/alanine dehydrogenase-like protein (mu-crystallin family)
MRRVSRGGALLPLRQALPVPGGGMLGMMPGYIDEPRCFGVKLVSLFPANQSLGLSSHSGIMVLYDAATGQPAALLNAGEITAIRTAAASALATKVLARANASVLGVVGTGEQALAHLRALALVRRFREIRIWGRNSAHAAELARLARTQTDCAVTIDATVDAMLHHADVVCTLTGSAEPILAGRSVRPGTHLCVVGSSVSSRREVDDDCVARSRFFVDYRASAMAQAGELLHAIGNGTVSASHILGEIGEVLEGRIEGRRSDDDITLYKSLGVAAQDLVAATVVLRAAESSGAGTLISL